MAKEHYKAIFIIVYATANGACKPPCDNRIGIGIIKVDGDCHRSGAAIGSGNSAAPANGVKLA